MTACSSAAVRSRWRATSARPRACRTRRSPIVSAARRRRSRRTSTIRPERRRGRSRLATRGCAAAAAPTPSRATARATRTRTARPAIPVRSAALDARASARRDAGLARRYGRLPSSYDWSRTHAHRRGGGALERLSEGDWPSASVVTGVFGSWKAARVVATDRIVEVDDRVRRSPECASSRVARPSAIAGPAIESTGAFPSEARDGTPNI